MENFKSLYEQVFSLDEKDFDNLALELFNFQYEHNSIYRSFVDHLTIKPEMVTSLTQIPFLPISFFKRHRIVTGSWKPQLIFESSGTTGQTPSRHEVFDTSCYLKNCRLQFERFYGSVENYTILALLPSYLEREHSSLVYMAQDFIWQSNDRRSGFFLDRYQDLIELLHQLSDEGKPTLLLGVTFGLLDLAEKSKLNLKNVIVMETGGMKGRREEMVRSEVHQRLTEAFGVNSIHSEYGMTELFSQAYSKGEGLFKVVGPLRVFTRDINDPLLISNELRNGALNIIDLANVHSCCFIATEDMGKVHPDGQFEVLGRMDNSDIRGCNLMLA